MILLSAQQAIQLSHISDFKVGDQRWQEKMAVENLELNFCKKKNKKTYTCISDHSNKRTKGFSWLHIPGMLQWVENKEESNQGAINTRAFICWGFGRVLISLWIHQLLQQTKSPVHLVSTPWSQWNIDKERLMKKENMMVMLW